MSIKKAIFVSYDLGLKGDYNGLYTWFDSLEAKECGTGLAILEIKVPENDHEKIYKILKKEISKHVDIEPNDRIYVILRAADKTMKGKFLFGGRKKAPWFGFASTEGDSEDSF